VKRAFLLGSLFVLNVLLAGGVIWNLKKDAFPRNSENRIDSPLSLSAPANLPETKRRVQRALLKPAAPTPYAAIYSNRPHEFAANLRRVGCPEETVKDILFAEINRRYHGREQQLRPKPADHVPFTWSPKTSEAKLLERRQQAASIAREKEGILRAALGYDVHVEMPLYAMTTSDLRFQETVESISPKNRPAAYQAQEQYWLRVEQLLARTRGFWEPADVEELNQVKRERTEFLDSLSKEQP